MEPYLRSAGVILCLLAIIHVIFPRYFQWKTELGNISLMNRQMMYVHTFFVGLTVFLMGLLCLIFSEELVHTYLGRYICLGLFIFWGIRMLFQFFVYSSQLWKGKRFETSVHIIFSFIWAYFTAVFFLAFWD